MTSQQPTLRPAFLSDGRNILEAGCDEVGRGCLAGPVVAAAVIWPATHPLSNQLNDSKKISADKRAQLCPLIQQAALGWAIGSASPEEIDQYNILQATFLAMHRAIEQLEKSPHQPTPQLLLVDGHQFLPYPGIPHQTVVRGDQTFCSIAAASILAKTYRDRQMVSFHKQYPHYLWDKNKGYATKAHRQAVNTHGLSPMHRRSFRLRQQPAATPAQPTLFTPSSIK